MQLPPEIRLINVQTGILRAAVEEWPTAVSIAAKPILELRHDASLFDAALEGLLVQGHIVEGRDPQHGGRTFKITSAGVFAYAASSAGTTWDDLENVKQTIFRTLAQVIDALEKNEAAQHELQTGVEETRQAARATEATFYSRIIPLFALFVAAFALLNAGAQAAVRTPASADPATTFWQTAAIMGPITVAGLVLAGLAWLVTRPR